MKLLSTKDYLQKVYSGVGLNYEEIDKYTFKEVADKLKRCDNDMLARLLWLNVLEQVKNSVERVGA